MVAKKESKGKIEEKYVVNIFESELVPQHDILSDEEKQKLTDLLQVNEKKLPKILSKDPAVKRLGAKKGDVIKITRASRTAGISIYYRLVV